MPKYPISITKAAEQDLAAIIEYITNNNPAAALRLAEEIDQNILKLEEFPRIGTPPKNRRLSRLGYSMLIIDSCLVFYVLLEDDTVEIRRIISSRRDYGFLL